MAELEDQKDFAELLSSGVKSLKLHPDFKIRRKKNEVISSGQSYLLNFRTLKMDLYRGLTSFKAI
jgi:hypothetical protein